MTTERLELLLSRDSETYVFDRSRLLIDLDEATDPDAPTSTLLVVGFRRRRDRSGSALTHNDVVLLDRLGELIAPHGAVYRTRATEVSALLDLTGDELEPLLEEIRSALVEHQRKATVGVGVVSVPLEAPDAIAALAVADERLIGQTTGLRVVDRLRGAAATDDEGRSGLAVVIDLVPRTGGRPTRRAGGLAPASARRGAAASLGSLRRSQNL